jgi:hypothetical protein
MSVKTVPVVAVLTLADGHTFTHRYDVESHYADSQEFWWTDGNMACDCNRAEAINREYGTELPVACGDSLVRLLSLMVDGQVVVQSEAGA